MGTIKGKVKVLGETQTVGTSNFRKRELVVTTDEQYPQMIMIEFVQDKCDLLNNFNIGDSVEVNVNLRGREWINPEGVTKYFNQIQGWKIEKTNVDNVESSNLNTNDNADDLPF